MLSEIQDSFLKLERYCEREGYRGWDPYDGLNSKVFRSLPILKDNKLAKLVWIQAFKKLPINLRRVVIIEKDFNAKGLALFISGYAQLSTVKQFHQTAIAQIKFLADQLLKLRTPGYSGDCWGYNFDWQSRAFFKKRDSPTIVATTYCANALLDAYEVVGDQSYLNAAESSVDFIIQDLNRTYDDDGSFAFSYSPTDKTSVFNASLLGAKLLSRIFSYTKQQNLADLARQAVVYCVKRQNPDGSWFYSPLPFHQWIDNFHTGFNLECISGYSKYTRDESFAQAFESGLRYYVDTFFDAEGRSKYYNNSLYPVDIHAPSQLIVTLSQSDNFLKFKSLIDRVTAWTIRNMQSPEGYFYYQKSRFYTNRIPYMRWSEAWIFYGLATYLANSEQ